MNTSSKTRIFWLCTLCLFLVGCSKGYYSVPLVMDAADVEQRPEDDLSLKPGDHIRFSKLDGTLIEGRFEQYNGRYLIVNQAQAVRNTAEGFDEIHGPETIKYAQTKSFLLADIINLERRDYDSKSGFVVAGLIAASLWAMIYTINNFELDWGE